MCSILHTLIENYFAFQIFCDDFFFFFGRFFIPNLRECKRVLKSLKKIEKRRVVTYVDFRW